MGILRVLLIVLLGAFGFEHAEQAMVARSTSALAPPFRPHPMRVGMTVILPPIPPPPPPPVIKEPFSGASP